jgi:hypothetical protein
MIMDRDAYSSIVSWKGSSMMVSGMIVEFYRQGRSQEIILGWDIYYSFKLG